MKPFVLERLTLPADARSPAETSHRIAASLLLLTPGLAASSRVFFKYTPAHAALITGAYACAVLLLLAIVLVHPAGAPIRAIVRNPWFAAVALLTVAAVAMWAYPKADGLKYLMQGSDQDDCVIMGVHRLAHFRNPYAVRTYLRNPCSTGPGVLLPYIPFVLARIYPLAAPVLIGLLTVAIGRFRRDWMLAGGFLVVLFSCALIPELLVVGSDLVSVGCALALATLMLEHARERDSSAWLLAAAVTAGLVASSRINMLVLVPLYIGFVFLHWRKQTVLFAVTILIVALLPAVSIYISDPAGFTPFHLLHKSRDLLPGVVYYVATASSLVSLVAAGWMIARLPGTLSPALLIAIAPSLFAVSLGDLFFLRRGDIAAWEGANYLIPLVPLAAYLLVKHAFEQEVVAAR